MKELNDAKEFLARNKAGILSTHSASHEGYPFGSLTPYVLNATGQPIILVSHLAEHTKNLVKNPKVCLTVMEEKQSATPQAQSRLSLLANAAELETSDQDSRKRYFEQFPETTTYEKGLNFRFYKLEPFKIRWIAGFGNVRWLDVE